MTALTIVPREEPGMKTCSRCKKSFPNTEAVRKSGQCRTCRVARSMAWARAHPQRKWEQHAKSRYGLTPAQYQRLLASQAGCAICGRVTMQKLHIDHDHKTGKVRALLCRHCNLAIGYAEENPEILLKMIQYLERFKS